MAEPPVRFGGVLRRLRVKAGLMQEELAGAAGLSPRAISDLERGMVTTPHKDTVQLLADALQLDGSARAEFEATAQGREMTGRAGAQGVAATRTLPSDIASFTGRAQELRELTDGRFPGGQIFLPLHGHTPGHQPVSPAEALASLLPTIGVPAGQIPDDHEARAGLWRDRLARRQLLPVLDDAATSDQVRPISACGSAWAPTRGGDYVGCRASEPWPRDAGLFSTCLSPACIPRTAPRSACIMKITGRAGRSSSCTAGRRARAAGKGRSGRWSTAGTGSSPTTGVASAARPSPGTATTTRPWPVTCSC